VQRPCPQCILGRQVFRRPPTSCATQSVPSFSNQYLQRLPQRKLHHVFTVLDFPFRVRYQNPLVIPGYSPPKRYKPYPSPRVFPSLQHLALERNSERTKRRRARYRRPGGSAIQPPVPAYTPHPQHSAGVVAVAASIPPMAEDCDVEMDEAIFTPEVDLIDVEMLDDFLP
jgi:hypothetical protein